LKILSWAEGRRVRNTRGWRGGAGGRKNTHLVLEAVYLIFEIVFVDWGRRGEEGRVAFGATYLGASR